MNHLKKNIITTFVVLCIVACPKIYAKNNYNIVEYGADSKGEKLSTDAINNAILDAHNHGGGTVYFPSGKYLSFSIRLKSNIRLLFETGSVLIAADPNDYNDEGYDVVDYNKWGDSLKYQDFGHSHWKNSLIWGISLENLIIEGHGLIYGKGLIKTGNKTPGFANKVIALKNCNNVTIKDISILQAGHFAILPTGVTNFTIDNVKIDSNRDGINIDCCKNVIITNCKVNTPNDDAIVLKSSFALGKFIVTENIVISNCIVSGYDMGSMLNGTFTSTQTMAPDKGGVTGRIKLGTESNGGFKNITITNCIFNHCRGLAIETVDGGMIEDITISNIVMKDIVNSPFYIRLGARMRGPGSAVPGSIKRINISNVTIEGVPNRYAALILGIPEYPVCDVDFNNIKMVIEGGATAEQADIEVPYDLKGYPDPRNHGLIPASGFYIRHANEIEFNNIEIKYQLPDKRPVFKLIETEDIRFSDIETPDNESCPIQRIDSKQLRITNFNSLSDTLYID